MTLRKYNDEHRTGEDGDLNHRAIAVDLWIKRELQRSYDQTLAEPVPEGLLRLIDSFPVRP